MSKTLLIVGIILTGLSILSITIFSISNFILKRIYKEEEQAKTKEEKQKEKTIKRLLKAAKKILKLVNKKLLQNYLAFYGVTSMAFAGGIAMVTYSSIKLNEESTRSTSEMTSNEEPSSVDSVTSELSSYEDSSEPSSSSEQSSSSSSESSSIEVSSIVNKYEVSFYIDENLFDTVTVNEGELCDVPNAIKKKGYYFAGWYLLSNSDTPFDFDNTPITSSFSVFAKYEEAFQVLFYYEEDNILKMETVDVKPGDKVEKLLIQIEGEEEGTYYEWTEEITYQVPPTPFDFDTPISQNYDLYAYVA